MAKASDTPLAALVSVTTLFFVWGFITATIDPLIPSVRAIFSLSYAESMLTQFAFFMAYGVVSLPAAALVARAGYGKAILVALGAMVIGCLVIPLATHLRTYELVLVALFIMASGITVLQVAANPLTAALGRPDRSHLRLTFAQAFNSLATVIAPFVGSVVMLRGGIFTEGGSTTDATQQGESLRNIDTSFLMIVVMIVLLGLLMWRFRARLDHAAPAPAHGKAVSPLTALNSRWALLGAAAIFLYVGAEVSIGSIMINFLHQDDVLGVTLERAGKLLSLYWLGAMVGRFLGSLLLLLRFRAARLLAIAAAVAAMLCLTVSQVGGELAAGAAIAVGLFNSIMFPVIFTVTLERSTASSAATSGLLCMAIVGGAILPVIAGLIADSAGLHAAFLLPMVAYAFISVFAVAASRVPVVAAGGAPEMAH